MAKIIAAINITIDGFCDHTGMVADDELHEHFNDLLKASGALLYGRTTYELMESYWPSLVNNPTGNKPMDDFAIAIDNIPKILFSHTRKDIRWKNTTLAKNTLKDEVTELKEQPGKDVLVGSPSLITALTNLGLIDEYQLCVHPVILGKGLPLFKDVSRQKVLTLLNSKTFQSGTVVHYYQPATK